MIPHSLANRCASRAALDRCGAPGRRHCRTGLCGYALCLAALSVVGLINNRPVHAADASSRTVDDAFFESKIRPVLVEHCYECHSADARPLQGGLRLDYRDGLLAGGDSGGAIDSEEPTASLLLRALRYDGVEMPPSGKLPSSVIADFESWIKAGAPDPRKDAPAASRVMVDPEKAASWWAFQKIDTPTVPDRVTEAGSFDLGGYESQVIDRFINKKLAAAGLEPAAPADRATLLRRVTFDLTGLPPSAEEVTRFISDSSPDAYERVVDRLLASPALGERWGRHWLDAARYADSNGADENHAFPVAWKYRDYVVRAFNQDLPYDRFVIEQLAGDLLPCDSHERRIELWTATGFLIIGPKMLAEQDKPKMIADIVDEQIDTVGQAFLAMTFGCARCHDHKFDPIATRDYYALAGIFHSTKTMANLDFVSKWNERELPDPLKQQEIDTLRGPIDALKEEIECILAANGKKKEADLAEAQRKLVADLRKQVDELEKALPRLPSVMSADEGPVKTVPVHVRGNHLQLGPDAIPRDVPTVFHATTRPPRFPEDQSGRLELARWIADSQHPLTSRVLVNRLWQGHFGEGLVRSPANFGLTGEMPTHPELLDWLACDLTAGGWEMKRMHRQIVLSDVYRRASVLPPEVAQRDLENRLWSRQNRRRLEVEPLRDALLTIGGNLDRAIGGQAEAIYDKYETTGKVRGVEDALRRTLYLPVNRAALSELLSTFDYVDSAVSVAKRNSTVVPHQSLFLMNSPLAIEQAWLLAKRIGAVSSSDSQRIDYAVRTLFGRPADAVEIEAALAFLRSNSQRLVSTRIDTAPATASTSQPREHENQLDRETRVWQRLCLSLFCASEFFTID